MHHSPQIRIPLLLAAGNATATAQQPLFFQVIVAIGRMAATKQMTSDKTPPSVREN
jgi:hypothetical protein